MRRANKSPISFEKLRVSTDILRALAHPTRLKMLEFIDKSKSANVNNILEALNMEQSLTSQHLRLLRIAGVVRATRAGKFIYYEVDYEKLEETIRAVGEFASFVDVDFDDDELCVTDED